LRATAAVSPMKRGSDGQTPDRVPTREIAKLTLRLSQAHADALVGYAEHMPHCHWGFGGETEPPRECDCGLSETLRAYEAFKAGEPT